MHKQNIWVRTAAGRPNITTPDLKHEIPRRLKDRILFGGDYPLFTYERLVREWRAEGYAEDVLDKLSMTMRAIF
jgi:predicted TIM-barrel fold metal-dependent hydrolase